jgi:hypothetical protein
MAVTKKDGARNRILDSAFNDPKQNADIFARVTRELRQTEALIEAKVAQRVASGEVPAVRERPFDLKDFLEEFVKDAARSGAVYYDASTGYACLRKADLPKIPAVGEANWGTQEWEAELHRQWEVRAYEENLAFALEDPRLHALALLWLDAPHVEAGVLSWMGARERCVTSAWSRTAFVVFRHQ